jgi:hypothetical protein
MTGRAGVILSLAKAPPRPNDFISQRTRQEFMPSRSQIVSSNKARAYS